MSEEILIDRNDGVLRLTFDRPEMLNALTGDMVAAATEAIEQSDDRVIVLSGTGRAFCTGADIAGLEPQSVGGMVDAANQMIRAIVSTRRPVVAAVNGPAAGVGCSIAVAADFTVAHESAYFLLSFTNIGLMPDGGSTHLVGSSIGRARAMKMAMLGERMPAHEAEDIGLIHSALSSGDYESGIEALVAKLAAGATASYARTKDAINAASIADLEAAFAREREGQNALMETADFAEGVTAFLHKRPRRFIGK